MRPLARTVIVGLLIVVPGCAERSSRPASSPARSAALEVREGLATYYGPGFDGKTMASGARFNRNAMVAAHPHYPFGTVVRVTHLANGRSVRVRILDRGPAARARRNGVVIDLSYGAARKLDFIRQGRARVRIEVLRWGSST